MDANRVRAAVCGTGSYLPESRLSNHDLEKMVETSDEWISTRTGIRSRRIAGAGEITSVLATRAARAALAAAGVRAEDIGLIVVATITAASPMPSCACRVQREIGADKAVAFDIGAACSGFVYGVDIVEKYIRANPGLKALVIGAETLSNRVDWSDRNTCVLFGDGAGAAVICGDSSGRGVLASRLFSDGRLGELLHMTPAAGSNPYLGGTPPEGDGVDFSRLGRGNGEGSYIKMAGREVFRNAVRAMEDVVERVLADVGLTGDDIDLLIPHQANIRILENLAGRLGGDRGKIYINVDKYGNTSAASIPIALDEAVREGRVRPGDLVMLCAFGGGFTWGAQIIRW